LSKRVSPAAVGGFVLGAIALAVGGLLLLSQARLFGGTDRFVVFFDETVRGLGVGSRVSYRGVDIGSVTSVQAIFQPADGRVIVPVLIDLRKDALVIEGGGEPTPGIIDTLVQRGLRAQLQIENFVTGRLLISLDEFPGTAIRKMGGQALGFPEIPSIRSPIAGITSSIDQLTMSAPDLVASITSILAEISALLSGETVADVKRGLKAGADLATALEDPQGPLRATLGGLPEAMAALQRTAAGLDQLVAKLQGTLEARDEQVGELLAELTRSAASARRAADQASTLLADNRNAVRTFTSRGLPEIQGLVEDTNRMVNELNALVRDIRQNPSRFFFGDQTREGVRLR
jgi:paraquat-inducible protein B